MQTTFFPSGVRRDRVEGGFVLVSVLQIVTVWWAYRHHLIGWRDLRTWFACQEIQARRCLVRAGEPRRLSILELDGLVGGSPRNHQASIRRLERAGLLEWHSGGIDFATSPERLPCNDIADLWDTYQSITNNKRWVPMPRRLLREIAGGFARAVTATVLGHLIRCVYYHKQSKTMTYVGCCKVSFISDVFGVCHRSVQAARQHLIRIGWLSKVIPQHFWHRQRHGMQIVVDHEWGRGGEYHPTPAQDITEDITGAGPGSRIAPLNPGFASISAPPDLNKELLRIHKYQKPPEGRSQYPDSGVYKERVHSEETARPDRHTSPPQPPPRLATKPGGHTNSSQPLRAPTMLDVRLGDLTDMTRLLVLYDDAVRRGITGPGYDDKLKFVSCAQRAATKGTRNPCGFFARLIRGKLYHHLTIDDEETAYQKLKTYEYGDPRGRTCFDFIEEEPMPLTNTAGTVLRAWLEADQSCYKRKVTDSQGNETYVPVAGDINRQLNKVLGADFQRLVDEAIAETRATSPRVLTLIRDAMKAKKLIPVNDALRWLMYRHRFIGDLAYDTALQPAVDALLLEVVPPAPVVAATPEVTCAGDLGKLF